MHPISDGWILCCLSTPCLAVDRLGWGGRLKTAAVQSAWIKVWSIISCFALAKQYHQMNCRKSEMKRLVQTWDLPVIPWFYLLSFYVALALALYPERTGWRVPCHRDECPVSAWHNKSWIWTWLPRAQIKIASLQANENTKWAIAKQMNISVAISKHLRDWNMQVSLIAILNVLRPTEEITSARLDIGNLSGSICEGKTYMHALNIRWMNCLSIQMYTNK